MRRFGPIFGAKAFILLALLVGGGAVTAGVVLPPAASDTAREATADVTPGSATQAGAPVNASGFEAGLPEQASITGDINSAFGQCVAARAHTQNPNENHPGANPTDACEGLRHQPSVEGQGEGPDHPTGLDRAEDRSGGNAGGQGQSASTQGGGNGASNANANGADNASARGGNSDK